MDDNRGQRGQNEPPLHSTSNQRYHQSLHDSTHERRPFPNTQGERRRPAPLNTSPSGSGRGVGGSTSYSGYYQEPTATAFSTTTMPQGAMGYHHSPTDYGQADTRQTQSFTGAYNPTAMMYNVPQAAGPQSTAVYDTNQQFSSRQPAGMQMMATDAAAPYFSSEPTSSAGASAMQTHSTSSSTPQVYQQPSLQRYSTSNAATTGGMAGQSASAADVRQSEEYPGSPKGTAPAYTLYLSKLEEIFQNIRSGMLAGTSDSLLHVSDWLLSNVIELGLTSDNQSLQGERIKLWNDFNYAWLALFQRQKELMGSGLQLQRQQSLISKDGLEKMAKELLRFCDGIERHGLVDYQYGVWEEQIITVLQECLDLYKQFETSRGDSGASASSSSHRR
ncbi:hypothetical protein B0T17DRAFT_484723 [Bombardia bombarda]|uniref:Uncharacterized protein n=1 Tax=Bombardia bombarda TaxID=252184 RepID=A0AA39XLW7_9PEZI|nr:hypothetical protein B0T17DRAFT_484723 [Bombardia bombarda]